MGTDRLLSALFEPRRRAILRRLADEPLPVGDLARGFDVSRPAISQHVAVLRDAGLVELQQGPGRNRYAVRPDGVAAARTALARLAGELPGDGAPASEAGPADVVLAVRCAAPAERLFALATTPEGLARWLGEAEVDLRVGGRYRIDLGGAAAAGTYEAVEPPGRLVFGWGQEDGSPAPDATEVELRFAPDGAETRVTLEHRRLPAEIRAPHLGSWATHVPQLVAAAESAG